ncbi:MAG: beta-glucuronidase [Negativicutes bacterium]
MNGTSSMYPYESSTRVVIDISGLWRFRFDFDAEGRENRWYEGLTDTVFMAVPASYNDIFAEAKYRDFVGDVWYQKEFIVPREWKNKRNIIRFGSVTHKAEVWLNGEKIVEHEGGYTPFEGELNEYVRYGEKNTVVICVNNELSKTTIPCGTIVERKKNYKELYPHFDFYNYSGIHRPVKLVSMPVEHINDITIVTDIDGNNGVIEYKTETTGWDNIAINVYDEDGKEIARNTGKAGRIIIENASFWQPGKAYLYDFNVKIVDKDKAEIIDEYSLPVGIRTVKIEKNKFLINGTPFYFKGFGKHEDSPVRGRGFDNAINLRDFELLKWIGANSVRTSHYPYSEEFIQLADRTGLVIIGEAPAVGLVNSTFNFMAGAGIEPTKTFFDLEEVKTKTLGNHKKSIFELINRDKNSPSVVMWCLANEPVSHEEAAHNYFKEIFGYARKLDPQNRPLTYANELSSGWGKCKIHKFCDVLCLNRYYGWYNDGGIALEFAVDAFKSELEGWVTTGKPIIISEYGADTMPGIHKLPGVMWSEEYQVEFLEKQHEVFDSVENIVGEHMWNFADFQTVQGIMRVDGNKKGAFTRDRQPKLAAHFLRNRWLNKKSKW